MTKIGFEGKLYILELLSRLFFHYYRALLIKQRRINHFNYSNRSFLLPIILLNIFGTDRLYLTLFLRQACQPNRLKIPQTQTQHILPTIQKLSLLIPDTHLFLSREHRSIFPFKTPIKPRKGRRITRWPALSIRLTKMALKPIQVYRSPFHPVPGSMVFSPSFLLLIVVSSS